MTRFIASVFVSISMLSCTAKDGATLYLIRGTSGTETKRAVFEYPADCRLIAQAMAKAEPMVTWYCK